MPHYLSIDPGIDTGWAALDLSGALVACSVGQPPVAFLGGPPVAVIIEKPQVYSSRQSKGDPNDLITLALGVGRYVERFEARGSRVVLVTPATWKGQVPKDIHHSRIYGQLTAEEQARVAHFGSGIAAGKRHNMMDAVGLAKWAYANKKLQTAA